MTNRELFYFAGNCLTLDERPGFRLAIIEKIEAGSIDWQGFVEVCSNHLVLTPVYLQFKKHGITGLLPEELAQHLEMVFELNQERNTRILAQIQEITNLLNGENIYPIFLKGAGNLIDGLYSSVGERIMNDIDFLVPDNDYLKSAKLLEANGYRADLSGTFDDLETMKHYPALLHPDFIAPVEIHRMPVSEKYSRWFNVKVVDREKRETHAMPGSFVLSDKHSVILNFVHSQLDHGAHVSGIVSLRDLYDFYLLSKNIDLKLVLPEIKSRARAMAYFRFAEVVFGLGNRFGGADNFSFRVFKLKHCLNLNSPWFYRFNQGLAFFHERISRYRRHIGGFVHSASARKSLIRRLRNPEWYRGHLEMYVNFFRGR